jgi:HD-GYP domain-containing protein (c-di-GMP phosphodiesterase class II)
MKEKNMLYKKLVEKTLEFHQLNDYDLILEKILSETRKFLNADAGTIYVKKNNFLKFHYFQNDTVLTDQSEGKKHRFSRLKLPINNESIAGYSANNVETLNIEDVYYLSEDLPYKFNKNYDKSTGYRTMSMITIPITGSNNNLLGVMQIINKLDPNYKNEKKVIPFSKEDEETIVKYFAVQAGVALERSMLTREIILRMVKMAEMRDPKETGAHVKRVSNYSAIIYEHWAKNKGMSKKEITKNIDILKPAAILHDVGKVGIPDNILKKPGKLTFEEFNIIKMHTVLGAKLFENASQPLDLAARDIALNHHEKWDGTGYPGFIDDFDNCTAENVCSKPKKGEEISVFGRVVAIADVFDALVSKRVYKPAWSIEDSVKVINEGAGKHFDPSMVEAFNSSIEEIKAVLDYFKE